MADRCFPVCQKKSAVFCIKADADGGRTAVASDRGIHGNAFDLKLFALAFGQCSAEFLCRFGSVGVTDEDPVLGKVFSKLFNRM